MFAPDAVRGVVRQKKQSTLTRSTLSMTFSCFDGILRSEYMLEPLLSNISVIYRNLNWNAVVRMCVWVYITFVHWLLERRVWETLSLPLSLCCFCFGPLVSLICVCFFPSVYTYAFIQLMYCVFHFKIIKKIICSSIGCIMLYRSNLYLVSLLLLFSSNSCLIVSPRSGPCSPRSVSVFSDRVSSRTIIIV